MRSTLLRHVLVLTLVPFAVGCGSAGGAPEEEVGVRDDAIARSELVGTYVREASTTRDDEIGSIRELTLKADGSFSLVYFDPEQDAFDCMVAGRFARRFCSVPTAGTWSARGDRKVRKLILNPRFDITDEGSQEALDRWVADGGAPSDFGMETRYRVEDVEHEGTAIRLRIKYGPFRFWRYQTEVVLVKRPATPPG